MNNVNFKNWLETFFEEKQIDMDRQFTIETTNNTHFIPVGAVYEHMLIASEKEQTQIKNVLVKIDFANGDVYHFLNHLAGAIASHY